MNHLSNPSWLPRNLVSKRVKVKKYLIYAEVIERIEPIKVLIKIRKEPDHVLVYHIHVV